MTINMFVSNKEGGHFTSCLEIFMETGSHLFVIVSFDSKSTTELITFFTTFILVGYLLTASVV
jgi:hypothetical protein